MSKPSTDDYLAGKLSPEEAKQVEAEIIAGFRLLPRGSRLLDGTLVVDAKAAAREAKKAEAAAATATEAKPADESVIDTVTRVGKAALASGAQAFTQGMDDDLAGASAGLGAAMQGDLDAGNTVKAASRGYGTTVLPLLAGPAAPLAFAAMNKLNEASAPEGLVDEAKAEHNAMIAKAQAGSTAGSVVGGLAGALLGGGAAGVGRGLATNVGINAAQGAITGANLADAPGESRLEGAALGAGLGALGGLAGAGVGAALGKAAAALRAAPKEAAEAIGARFTQGPGAAAPAELSDQALAKTLQDAARGNVAARETLAKMANVNTETRAAFKSLGIEDVPVDVISDSPRMRALAGITRSKVGSEAEAATETLVGRVLNAADDTMAKFDATFVDGAPSAATVSDKVLTSMKDAAATVAKQEGALHDAVRKAVPPSSSAQLNNTRTLISAIRKDVGDESLRPAERALLRLTDDPDATMGALLRAKQQIGDAMARRESPFADVDTATLKRLYGALAQDQVDNVERIGGSAARKMLREANVLTGSRKRMEERMAVGFGKQLEGSLVPLMNRAVESAAKGDATAMKKLIDTVPPELRKEVVATSLASTFRKSGGGMGSRFDTAGFASKYEGLRRNPQAYAAVVKELGPEAGDALQALYVVSKRTTQMLSKIKGTGKDTDLATALDAPTNLVEKIMASTLGRAGATLAAGKIAGPFAGAGVNVVGDVLAGAKGRSYRAMVELFRDPSFADLAVEMAKRGPDAGAPKAVEFAAKSPAWKSFAKAANLPTSPREAAEWLAQAASKSAIVEESRQ